jgi:hypothetical protein
MSSDWMDRVASSWWFRTAFVMSGVLTVALGASLLPH